MSPSLLRPFSIGLFSLALAACSHDDGDAQYEGCATDENQAAIDDYINSARIKMDPSAAPKWIEPTADGALSASAPPTLRWQPTAAVAGSDKGDATCPQFQSSSLRLGPRHLPTVSGTVYDLQFKLDGSTAYRIVTTKQSAAVPTATWAEWSGRRVTVEILRARLLQNDVAEGPFQGIPRTLEVKP